MTKKYDENNKSLLKSCNYNCSINSFQEAMYKQFNIRDKFAVCIFNISNFKYYNYRFGYEYGDIILKIVFDRVLQAVESDGFIYRPGGDTLIILLNTISNKSEVTVILDRIINAFNAPVEIGEEKLTIAVNLGISIYPDDGKDIDSIMKYAEIALNNSKESYLDTYKFFERIMYENVMTKNNTELDILNAVRNNEFTLYYQPQMDIKTMKIYGVEALLRWKHPKLGILPPSYFIDIVEENGIINEIGKYVLKEACRQLQAWHTSGYENLIMSINISEKQLNDSSFLDFLEGVLKKTQVDPRFINIEITERILINPTEEVMNILSALKEKGIKIIIDDFGTRYSSLNYLYCLPVDEIKIDKSFIDKIMVSQKGAIILKNIINMAHEINLDVVAEGVESKEQLYFLSEFNCSKIQGFIFGQPVNPDLLEDYLIKYENK